MNNVPNIVPISEMAIKPNDVMAMLARGPVILAQRSKAAAVLVSVDEWDRRAEELARLRRIVLSDRQFAAMDAGEYVDHDEVIKALKEA